MKKLALSFVMIFVSLTLAKSQDYRYEVYGGLSLPHTFYPAKGDQSRETSKMILSGHLGVRTFIPISIDMKDNMFYATTGLAFSGKGYKTKNLYKYYRNVVVEGKALSIDVPARFGYKFRLNENIALRAELGFAGSLGLFGKWKRKSGTSTESTGKYYDMDNLDPFGSQRIDFGFSGHVGAEFNRITAGVSYDYGIANLAGKPYHSSSRNLLFSIGYLF